ncbi:hypothetical protein NIES2104_67270 [Leptolyngbya sp. NIES-2104]|nr:hypothetical protein NIES2104_67270 [Leptolyngbya sp. NIES-2104]
MIAARYGLIVAAFACGVYAATLSPQVQNDLLRATGRNERVIMLRDRPPISDPNARR